MRNKGRSFGMRVEGVSNRKLKHIDSLSTKHHILFLSYNLQAPLFISRSHIASHQTFNTTQNSTSTFKASCFEAAPKVRYASSISVNANPNQTQPNELQTRTSKLTMRNQNSRIDFPRHNKLHQHRRSNRIHQPRCNRNVLCPQILQMQVHLGTMHTHIRNHPARRHDILAHLKRRRHPHRLHHTITTPATRNPSHHLFHIFFLRIHNVIRPKLLCDGEPRFVGADHDYCGRGVELCGYHRGEADGTAADDSDAAARCYFAV